MENPNLQTNNAGEGMASPHSVLENMPSYEEHMRSFESQREAEQNSEVMSEQRKRELKEKFLFGDYGKYYKAMCLHGCDWNAACKDYQSKTIQNYQYSYYETRQKLQDYASQFRENGVSIESAFSLIEDLAKISDESNHELSNEKRRIRLYAEFEPSNIEKKYGPQVEECNISLADINRILEQGYNYQSDAGTAYEYFCENLPNVIEKHFSDDIPVDHKQIMGSIIGKIIQSEDETYRRGYFHKQYGDEPLSKDIEADFSDDEIDFLAKEYSEANKKIGNNFDDIRIATDHDSTMTNDKLLDSVFIHEFWDGDVDKFRNSKIGKRMKEYME